MDDHEITTFPQPDDYRVTRFDPGSIFRVEMQMIRTRTLLAGVFVILLFLLPAPSQVARAHQVARAQEVPCDNSQAASVIPTNEKDQPLMPKEIQCDAGLMKKLKDDRLTKEVIKRCLENNEPLTNHVIDFDRYVAAWEAIKDPKRALRIQDSVLWSFKEKGQVNLATFAENTEKANKKVTHVVTGKIEWDDVTLGPSFSAKEVAFPQQTSFDSSRFPKHADFSNTTFGNHVSFSRAIFGDNTRSIDDDIGFYRATFGDDAAFSRAIFGNNASFKKARFGDNTFFVEATFGNNASFEEATFGDNTFFVKALFNANASFFSATFGGDINLRCATVKGELNLLGTNWEGRANFREAEIQNLFWDSENHPSDVKGIFDAREAKFKKAVIKDVHFSDLVDFSDVDFGGSREISFNEDKFKVYPCGPMPPPKPKDKPPLEQSKQETEKLIFQNLIFEKEVDFLRATFRNDAIFVRNRFRSVWDLTGAKFLKKEVPEDTKNPHLCLSFNRINKLFLERQHLSYESSWTEYFFPDLLPLTALEKSRIRGVRDDGSYSCSDFSDKSNGENESGKENEELWEIYKTISSTFRGTNDRLAENEAWYLSLVAERESQYSDAKDSQFLIALRYWTSLIFADFPSRYGIDLYRVVLVSVGFMLFFAIIYWCNFLLQIHVYKWKPKVNLKPFPDQKRAFRFRPFERFSQSRAKQWRPLHPLKDALFLSGRAFFKLGLGTTYPRTRMLVWIASVEWIVGMYMLIHFLIAVKNTLPIAVPFLAVAG